MLGLGRTQSGAHRRVVSPGANAHLVQPAPSASRGPSHASCSRYHPSRGESLVARSASGTKVDDLEGLETPEIDAFEELVKLAVAKDPSLAALAEQHLNKKRTSGASASVVGPTPEQLPASSKPGWLRQRAPQGDQYNCTSQYPPFCGWLACLPATRARREVQFFTTGGSPVEGRKLVSAARSLRALCAAHGGAHMGVAVPSLPCAGLSSSFVPSSSCSPNPLFSTLLFPTLSPFPKLLSVKQLP